MALFRLHRGSLEDSLKTTVIVNNINDIKKIIYDVMKPWIDPENCKDIPDFSVRIYCPVDFDNCFDPRCGWYTHYVTADIGEKGVFTIQGMLSEPLESDNAS